MPTYEYKREDGTTFEVKQGINEEPLKTCPDTDQKVKRVISGGGGVVYKGEGWYITDYKDNDRKKKAEAEKKSSEKDEKPSKKKTAGKKGSAAKKDASSENSK